MKKVFLPLLLTTCFTSFASADCPELTDGECIPGGKIDSHFSKCVKSHGDRNYIYKSDSGKKYLLKGGEEGQIDYCVDQRGLATEEMEKFLPGLGIENLEQALDKQRQNTAYSQVEITSLKRPREASITGAAVFFSNIVVGATSLFDKTPGDFSSHISINLENAEGDIKSFHCVIKKNIGDEKLEINGCMGFGENVDDRVLFSPINVDIREQKTEKVFHIKRTFSIAD